MLEFKELWKGNYMSVISPIKHPYECVHEPDVIMVFPVLEVKSKFVKDLTNYYMVVRKEFCPPYFVKKDKEEYFYTCVTGGIEEGESPDHAMKRELVEETGIELLDYDIIFERHDIPICKTSDMRSHIYGLLIKSFNPVEATGDGTVNEAMASTIFVNLNKMDEIINKPNIDFLLYSGYSLLMSKIGSYIQL